MPPCLPSRPVVRTGPADQRRASVVPIDTRDEGQKAQHFFGNDYELVADLRKRSPVRPTAGRDIRDRPSDRGCIGLWVGQLFSTTLLPCTATFAAGSGL